MLWNCGEEEPKDCAGVAGGNSICGCTDSLATNFEFCFINLLDS